MTLHPTYIKMNHELRYNQLREEATNNQQTQKVQQPKAAIRIAITESLGDLLINVGHKLAGHQATT